MDEVIDRLMPLLIRFEGLYLKPYLCPAKVPTIGLGSTRYMDRRRVTLADPPITRTHAIMLAREQLRTEYIPAVLKLCPKIDSVDRLAAITDFTYNLGAGNLQASTLRRRVNVGRWADVPYELSRWTKAGGVVLRGLVLRRQVEANMCR